MGIGGIGSKLGYSSISYVLALVLFFSVASIVLQPSYQSSHEITDYVEFPIVLCPIQEGVYYKNWFSYGVQPDRRIAVCDKTLGGVFSFMPNATEFANVNNATGINRNDAKKFHDFKFAGVQILASDIVQVNEVNLTAHARNTGTNDNKLDFMLFTGTKSADWLTLKTFFPVSTNPQYTTYQFEMKKNPKSNNFWTPTEVQTWVSGGKTVAFGLNEQIRQTSGKTNVGTYTVTVGINATAIFSFDKDYYDKDGVDPVILSLDGPAGLGQLTVKLSNTAGNNISVILPETSPGFYTNANSYPTTLVLSSPGTNQLLVNSGGDTITAQFLTLSINARVLADGTSAAA